MITSTDTKIIYDGDGITTAFPYVFGIINPSDVSVIRIDEDGSEHLLTADYYVDAANVNYPGYAPGGAPPVEDQPPVLPANSKLCIYRSIPQNQLLDLPATYPLNTIEAALDKLTMLIQQVAEVTGRSFTLTIGNNANLNLTIPVGNGKTFRWSDDGTALELTEDPAVVYEVAVNLYAAVQAAISTTESARDAAALSESNALSYKNSAQSSASSAATSETNAAASALAADTSAITATTQAGIATAKAGEASASAGTATTQAEIAVIQANSASSSANIAAANAETATDKASEAGIYATNAYNQAMIATNKAAEAGSYATTATAKATAANNSAIAAALSETNSANSASTAATSAANASISATAAAGSASNAAASAATATSAAEALTAIGLSVVEGKLCMTFEE